MLSSIFSRGCIGIIAIIFILLGILLTTDHFCIQRISNNLAFGCDRSKHLDAMLNHLQIEREYEHSQLDLSKFDMENHPPIEIEVEEDLASFPPFLPQLTRSLIPQHGYEKHRRLVEKEPETEEDDNYDENKPWTGSFANCKPKMKTSLLKLPSHVDITSHPDSDATTISCRKIHYRAPKAEIERGGQMIVVGVLSGAGGKGPLRRDSIRSTWARDRDGVYFIVAGPFEEIEKEYDQYRDLIWLDEEEVYEGEESVLPFKTEAFIEILHKFTFPGKAGFEYLFKTDDDSYVNLPALEKAIVGKRFDYWGCCTTEHFKPLRSPTRKWRVSFDLYPEEFYPLYCQGAGFALSKKFVECISENIADFRYNPFEDVSIGLLAERCGILPQTNFEAIKQYRTEEAGEKKQLNDSKMDEIYFLPRATMRLPKVLQHRVKTHYDMFAHYICVQEGT